jgi:hypothetical protein
MAEPAVAHSACVEESIDVYGSECKDGKYNQQAAEVGSVGYVLAACGQKAAILYRTPDKPHAPSESVSRWPNLQHPLPKLQAAAHNVAQKGSIRPIVLHAGLGARDL